jgi:hypothetical protein
VGCRVGDSPIDKQAKIFCASHTVLAHRDVSRAVVPPLGLLHRRELRDHDSFDRSFTLEELEWPVRGVEGLRAGEVVRLRVKHIDSAQKIIRIEQSKGRKCPVQCWRSRTSSAIACTAPTAHDRCHCIHRHPKTCTSAEVGPGHSNASSTLVGWLVEFRDQVTSQLRLITKRAEREDFQVSGSVVWLP